MQIDQRVVGDVTILSLGGKLAEYSDIADLESLVRTHAKCGELKIILDLSNCPYINSSGLGGIVRSYTCLNRCGGILKLLQITDRVRNLLSISKLLSVFEVYEAEAAAIDSFATVKH